MKEEVSCEFKDTKGLLQKFKKSCYKNIKSSGPSMKFLPATKHKETPLGQTTANEVMAWVFLGEGGCRGALTPGRSRFLMCPSAPRR